MSKPKKSVMANTVEKLMFGFMFVATILSFSVAVNAVEWSDCGYQVNGKACRECCSDLLEVCASECHPNLPGTGLSECSQDCLRGINTCVDEICVDNVAPPICGV